MGKACVYCIFGLKMITKKILAEGRMVYVAFMDLRKAFDSLHREAVWDV